MVFFSPLLVAALLPIAARAANDWTQPCFGKCNWDINADNGSGTVQITGTQSGVSDLTTAAGWTILDCDPNAADQDIRLVCHDPDAGCDHVHTNGAAGTLVRLPTSCGSVPFALVTRMWTHQDQSIPASKRALFKRRGGSKRRVKGVSLSTDFAQADPSSTGNVTMHIQGSSLPGVASNFLVPPSTGAQLDKRGLSSWVPQSLLSIGKVHKNITGSAPINFEKDVPLFDKSIDCPQSGKIPAFSGEVTVDLDGTVDGTVSYGVAASGTVIPPKIDDFGLFVGLDTSVVGTINVDATLTGSFTTGKIPLFEAGIPGLDFPGLFSIGPTFSVNAKADASLDSNVNTAVDIDYSITGAQLFFPPSSGPSGSFVPGDSQISLSASPDATANGQITAHLIPSLAFGVSALAGKAKANIHLDVDGHAEVDLSLTASGTASTMAEDKSKSFGGCVDVTSGLTVSAGADADFLSIFKKTTSVSLFDKTFDLFKKCFGDSAARRAYTGRKARAELLSKRADLACPSSALASAVEVVSEKVSGSSLT